jgi:hypothetical protein
MEPCRRRLYSHLEFHLTDVDAQECTSTINISKGQGAVTLKMETARFSKKEWQYSNFYTIPSSHIRIHNKLNYAVT